MQATWNLHERSAGPALAAAAEAGLTVYVKEALANGRLAGRAAPPELTALAAERGTTADALALAAVLAQPWADVVLSGAATVETLRSNLAAAGVDRRGRARRPARGAGGLLGPPLRAHVELTISRAARMPLRSAPSISPAHGPAVCSPAKWRRPAGAARRSSSPPAVL